jgi:selenophosphate synthase
MGDGKMTQETKGRWRPDLKNMTCLNEENKIEVVFEKAGKTFIGKLHKMPDELVDSLVDDPNSGELIINTITEAEEAFLKAHADAACLYQQNLDSQTE